LSCQGARGWLKSFITTGLCLLFLYIWNFALKMLMPCSLCRNIWLKFSLWITFSDFHLKLCSPGWPWTCDCPTSVSWVLGLQVCITCLNLILISWFLLYFYFHLLAESPILKGWHMILSNGLVTCHKYYTILLDLHFWSKLSPFNKWVYLIFIYMTYVLVFFLYPLGLYYYMLYLTLELIMKDRTVK
jgi:hypothetical protein